MENTVAPFHVLQPGSLHCSLILRHVERQHPHFWFDDGNLILASAAMDFRVHIQEVALRSSVLAYQLGSFVDGLVRGIAYVSILGEDLDDWACLLGLIYDEGGNAMVSPTLREILGVLRVAGKYGFSGIEGWGMAHLRADFFPNPQHFQVGDSNPSQAEEMLANSLEVIAASHHSRFETATLTLAYYALARRGPNAPEKMRNPIKFSVSVLNNILRGRETMQRRFEKIGIRFFDIAHQRRPNTSAHCPKTCWRLLVDWAADARTADVDVLKVLRHMCEHTPPGPVCPACVLSAHVMIQEETISMYRSLPMFFGFAKTLEGWVLTDDQKQFLSKSFRP